MPNRRAVVELFLVSALGLFAEMVFIRWVASELRVVAFYKTWRCSARTWAWGWGLPGTGGNRMRAGLKKPTSRCWPPWSWSSCCWRGHPPEQLICLTPPTPRNISGRVRSRRLRRGSRACCRFSCMCFSSACSPFWRRSSFCSGT